MALARLSWRLAAPSRAACGAARLLAARPPPAFARACATSQDSAHAAKQPYREYREPTVEECKQAPQSIRECSDELLMLLSEQDDHGACEERLQRNVMATDEIGYDAAAEVMGEIRTEVKKHMFMYNLPYKVGIASGIISGFGCIPLVFHKESAEWFNDKYVTSEEPPPEELNTLYEVGSWSWGWMEPPLGTLSFMLLALQVVRAQMQNMDLRVYTSWVKDKRGERLTAAFPRYNEHFVMDYARTAHMSK